ncbi:MAG: hypothetical protein ACXWCB_02270 [Acidimicrobiales bacterium]
MAKNRCPICGATHKDPPRQCRLCGHVMDGTVSMPSVSTTTMARPVAAKKKGVGSFMLIGVVAVVVIAVLAILLGFTKGDLSAGSIRNRIPFLRHQDDGWVQVDDAEGGFTVEMPSNRQAGSTPFPPAQNGRLTGWTATIGTDTSLAVYYAPLVPVDGETAKGTVNRMVDEAIDQTKVMSAQHNHDTQLIKRTDTTFQGYPAVVYTLSGVDINGQFGYQKAIIFVKGDTIYTLASNSIYQDHPQWDRFTGSFHFTA